jgi:GalNAc5-diNAcBac-PP-undecaprenol beta-1,3-glucosyltransferase
MRAVVTLVVRTHNRAQLVSRAIDSALAQTYPNLAVVVVDDGSEDGTQEVLAAYEGNPQIRLVRHADNMGPNAAGNTGLKHLGTETRYFGLLDSDDTLEPDAVETLVHAFEVSEGRYSLVLGWCRDTETRAPTGRMTHLSGREGMVTYEDALSGHFTGDFWLLARRDLLHGLRFDERARGSEGSVWWRLLRERPGWLVPAVVLNVSRSGSDRVSIPRYQRDVARGRMCAEQAMLDAIGADLRLHSPRAYAGSLAELAKWAALAGEGVRARAASRQALREAPSRRTLFICFVVLVPRPLLRWVSENTTDLRIRKDPA